MQIFGYPVEHWLALLNLVVIVGVMVQGYLRMRGRGEFATKQEADELSERLDKHHDRLTMIEVQVAALPSTKTMHELALSMAQLGGEIKVMAERLGSTREQLDRIDRILERHEDIMAEAATRTGGR